MSLGFIPSIMGSYQRLSERMILFGLFFLKITLVKWRFSWEVICVQW